METESEAGSRRQTQHTALPRARTHVLWDCDLTQNHSIEPPRCPKMDPTLEKTKSYADKQLKWDQVLSIALICIWMTPRNGLQLSPYEIMYYRSVLTPQGRRENTHLVQ